MDNECAYKCIKCGSVYHASGKYDDGAGLCNFCHAKIDGYEKLQAQLDRAIEMLKDHSFCDFNCKNEENCSKCRYIMEGE